jgi:hypothetical protein
MAFHKCHAIELGGENVTDRDVRLHSTSFSLLDHELGSGMGGTLGRSAMDVSELSPDTAQSFQIYSHSPCVGERSLRCVHTRLPHDTIPLL